MESQQIITVTPDQLQRMIDAGVDRAIDRVVPKLADYILNVEKQEKPDRMSIEQAIEFLAEHGYPVSYTHLDVYKRQVNRVCSSLFLIAKQLFLLIIHPCAITCI